MTEAEGARVGGPLFFAGAVIMTVGLLGATGEADRASALIGFFGAAMSGAGLFLISRRNGWSGTPHAAPWIGEGETGGER